jgi:hypothetical protein
MNDAHLRGPWETSVDGSPEQGKTSLRETTGVPDFRTSCIVTAGSRNSVKFIPESRCTILDSANSLELEFIHCASCKAEHTFARGDLFIKNNYDFTPVFGRDLTSVMFRRFAAHHHHYRQLGNIDTEPLLTWGEPRFHIDITESSELLPSAREIIAATQRGAYLVAQTEFADSDRGLHVILEYPVKTINTNEKQEMYQVDTGPIVFPYIRNGDTDFRNTLHLCYIAFNNFEKSEVIVETPTSIFDHIPVALSAGQNPEVNKHFMVDHYCDIRSLDATHRIYSIGPGGSAST